MAESTATKKAAKKRTAKKTTVKRTRKAPTTAPVTSGGGVPSVIKYGGALLVAFAVITGVSLYIGMKDVGEINVRSVINEKADVEAARGNDGESEVLRNLGNKKPSKPVANGGLVGAGNRSTRQQTLENEQVTEEQARNASSTATTTEATASSTEAVTTEETVDENTESTDAEGTADDTAETETTEEQ